MENISWPDYSISTTASLGKSAILNKVLKYLSEDSNYRKDNFIYVDSDSIRTYYEELTFLSKLIDATKNEKLYYFEYNLSRVEEPMQWLYSLERALNNITFITYSGNTFVQDISLLIDQYCEKLRKIYIAPFTNKLRFNLSVPVLSALLTIMKIDNIILGSKRSTYRIAAQIFTCSTLANPNDCPSEKSMKNNWVKVDIKTLQKCEDYLLKMLNTIRALKKKFKNRIN